jgi:hypothetical protein
VVSWPAIIKYQGESELTFVSSESEWECDADLHFFSYEEGDVLIDSLGSIYALDERIENCIKPRATGRCFDRGDILEIIKEHFSCIGECCVSKFAINTILEGIAIVGSVEEK